MARQDERNVDPHTALAQAVARRFEATAGYKNVLDERGNAMLGANEKSGPRSKEYLALEERLKQDEQQLERIKMALRRPISRQPIHPLILVAVAIVLAILETPANKFLFDMALQSAGIVSLAVSAGVTLFLLILAHVAGRSIRQIWSDFRHTVIWSNLFLFLLCIGVAGTIVSVLTIARAAFASEGGTIGDLLTGLQGAVEAHGPLGALLNALADTNALVLACINLGGIAAAFVLSILTHDSDRDFNHAQDSVESLEKRLHKVHSTYLDERRRIIKRFAPDLVGFAANYNTANSRVIELKTRLQMPLDDDDRFVLTDLDQMSEDAEREDGPPSPPESQFGDGRTEPGVTSMSDYRRQAGTEAS